jgi:tetratricopeptide (TPR) repeat protein
MLRPSFVLLALSVLLLVGQPSARADDVPAKIRTSYDEAMSLFEAGEFKPAFQAISKAKGKNPASVDYWDLYVRIWRAMGKKEKILWEKTIAKAEAKNPGSPVFHILRARFATTTDERIAHLTRGMQTAPEAADPRALLAREYMYSDRELARDLVDRVLGSYPAHELALALRGKLMLAAGRGSEALNHVKAELAKHDYPALHDLYARVLLAVAPKDPAALLKAQGEAQKAVEARPKEWRFALTLVEVMDRRGESAKAKSLLVKANDETPSPDLAAKLGEFAFREGDYTKAVRGIVQLPYDDVRALKALAVGYVRLGNAGEAEDVLRRLLLLQNDNDMRYWVALRQLEMGDAKAAGLNLMGQSGEHIDRARLRVAAWQGDPEEAKKAAGRNAVEESRAAEEWVLPIAHALLFEALGSRADGGRKLLLDAAAAAAKANIKTATVPEEEPLIATYTLGYLMRHATYRRALDGSWFEPEDEMELSQKDVDDVPTPIATVEGRSKCERDDKRYFPFRPVDAHKAFDMKKTMDKWMGKPAHQRWRTALGGFNGGCLALISRDFASARQGFEKAIEKEPGWGRARMFLAVALALEGADLPKAALEAERAVENLIDDWDGRTACVLVRYLAKRNLGGELKALAERRESFAPRRYDDL